MKLTAPILASGATAVVVASGFLAARAAAPPPLSVRSVAAASAAPASTVTVVGSGSVLGTPDQANMSFGVEVTAPSASAAYAGEADRAQRLIAALRAAGVKDSDIQTQWVSLYRNDTNGTFDASSSVSAVIHGLAHAGSVIDAAVRAAGDSVRLQGISLSIGDTSALMANARAAAVHNAQSRAQEYAQAAGLKLGALVSISETDSAPRPVFYGAQAASAGPAQPIEAGQQTLQVSVTVVYGLVQ